MTDTDVHSCGYYCDRPLCIKAQRNELRNKLFSEQPVKTYSGGKPNYTQPIEKAWVGLTDQEIAYIESMTLDTNDAIRMAAVALMEKNT
jgi:hypothetical protein